MDKHTLISIIKEVIEESKTPYDMQVDETQFYPAKAQRTFPGYILSKGAEVSADIIHTSNDGSIIILVTHVNNNGLIERSKLYYDSEQEAIDDGWDI